jgi:hypothetical protein
MPIDKVTLSVTPRGNGFQATICFEGRVTINSSETFPTIAKAITAAAARLLDMPERIADMDR